MQRVLKELEIDNELTKPIKKAKAIYKGKRE